MTLLALNRVEINSNNERNDNPVNIYVKVAYTTLTATYQMPLNISLSEMMERLKRKIEEDFGVEENMYEIVEAGQRMPLGIPAEEAPAFIIEPVTISQKFVERTWISFYIRISNRIANTEDVSRNLESEFDTESTTMTTTSECMVCQESDLTLTQYFGCCHYICDACCAGCLDAGIQRCAICRCSR